MTWRDGLSEYIDITKTEGVIYHFGLWFGESLCQIANVFKSYGQYMHFGFDSFQGLPLDPNEPLWHPEWHPETGHVNAYSAKTWADVMTVDMAVDAVATYIKNNTTEEFRLVPGFYKDSLRDDLVQNLNLKPAIYVDIDCDLYTSTIECLDFMFRNHLICSGTIIGFDDWKCTPGWDKNETGESRAWSEISKTYNVESVFLYDGAENWIIKVGSLNVS